MRKCIRILSVLMAAALSVLMLIPAAADGYAETAQTSAIKAMEYHRDNFSTLFAADYTGDDAIKTDMEHVLARFSAGLMADEDYSYLDFTTDMSAITDDSYSREYAKSVIISALKEDNDGVKAFADALCLRQDESGSFKTQGKSDLMDDVWGLIALQSAKISGYEAEYDAEAAVDAVIAQKKSGGGYNNYGDEGVVDTTAMVLMSLSFFDYDAAVSERESCIEFIASKLQDGGYFEYYGADSSCAQAYTIIGLIMAGEDVTSDKWTKGGGNIVDALLSFQDVRGGFWADSDSQAGEGWFSEPDDYSTRQCVMALGAISHADELYSAVHNITEIGKGEPPAGEDTVSQLPSEDNGSTPSVSNPETGEDFLTRNLNLVIIIAVVALILFVSMAVTTVINNRKKEVGIIL